MGTIDRQALKYIAAFGIQPRGQEIISNLKDMVLLLVNKFLDTGKAEPKSQQSNTPVHPTGIIYFRDGVGESQYNQVSLLFILQ